MAEAIQRERDAAAQQDEHDDAGEGQHEAETDGAPGTLLEDGSAEVSGGVDATRGAVEVDDIRIIHEYYTILYFQQYSCIILNHNSS